MSADSSAIIPEDNTVWSVGSGYGATRCSAKKCLALRIASKFGEKEGWLAEHMLIVGVESPEVRSITSAGHFPGRAAKRTSRCWCRRQRCRVGRLTPWATTSRGLRAKEDGRLWADQSGVRIFRRAPGHGLARPIPTRCHVQRNTIFTNAALRPDGTLVGRPRRSAACQRSGLARQGVGPRIERQPELIRTPASPRPPRSAGRSPRNSKTPMACRSTQSCSARAPRQKFPLVYQSLDWQHGMFLGATLSSETTAAASGDVGVLRRDPMAMLPSAATTWGSTSRIGWRWPALQASAEDLPRELVRTTQRASSSGPGFGENLRVLRWVIERCKGAGQAEETAIGHSEGRDAEWGRKISQSDLQRLVAVDREGWKSNSKSQENSSISSAITCRPEFARRMKLSARV